MKDSKSGSIDRVKPITSELCPISLSFPLLRSNLITFTAPIAAASGANSFK